MGESERGVWAVVVVVKEARSEEGGSERERWIGNFLFLKVGPTSSKFISIRSQRVF